MKRDFIKVFSLPWGQVAAYVSLNEEGYNSFVLHTVTDIEGEEVELVARLTHPYKDERKCDEFAYNLLGNTNNDNILNVVNSTFGVIIND